MKPIMMSTMTIKSLPPSGFYLSISNSNVLFSGSVLEEESSSRQPRNLYRSRHKQELRLLLGNLLKPRPLQRYLPRAQSFLRTRDLDYRKYNQYIQKQNEFVPRRSQLRKHGSVCTRCSQARKFATKPRHFESSRNSNGPSNRCRQMAPTSEL